MPKRILMAGISPSYGGTEAVIYSLLPFLAANGYAVDFLNTYDCPLSREEWLKSMGSNVYPLNLRRRGRYAEYKKETRAFFEENASKFDVLWINYQYVDQVDLLLLATKYGIKKRIALAHNSGAVGKRTVLGKLNTWFNKKKAHRYVTDYVGVSVDAARFAFGPTAQATIITSGINVSRFRFSKERREVFRALQGWGANEIVISSVGRLHPDKNQMFLLDVFHEFLKKIPDSRLVIAGSGELEGALRERAALLGIQDRFSLFTELDDVAKLYDASDLFVFPSKGEGLGMVLLEAQCSGLPCYASDGVIPAQAKVREPYHWIDLSNSASAWAEIIDPTELQSLEERENAYRILLDHQLSVEDASQKYLALLNR